MIRKIKGLGLAFVAIAAMSMAAASAVQASELHATDPGPVSIFGTKTATDAQHIFTTAAGIVKCTQSIFEGTVPSSGGQQTTAQHITVTGTYTGCTAFGLAATIDMNGCKYTITGAGQPANTALVDITGCTAGKRIEITVSGCTITVPEQHGLSHIVFTNAGVAPNEDVTADITISGITYETHDAAGGACPQPPIPTQLRHDGTYHGQETFQARKDTGSTQATHNGHQYQKLSQVGALVGLLCT